jgi:energy-coupling factor transporter transmembrane protein EcfT
MQGYAVLWFQKFKNADDPHRLRQRASHTLMFLVLLFGLNVMIAQLDPSWHQLNQYIQLNSRAEMVLLKIIPAAFAGTTGLWFGIVTLAIMALSVFFQAKLEHKTALKGFSFFLPFFLLAGFYTVITLSALTYAIEWQVTFCQMLTAGYQTICPGIVNRVRWGLFVFQWGPWLFTRCFGW